jgi:hypothetical protein
MENSCNKNFILLLKIQGNEFLKKEPKENYADYNKVFLFILLVCLFKHNTIYYTNNIIMINTCQV